MRPAGYDARGPSQPEEVSKVDIWRHRISVTIVCLLGLAVIGVSWTCYRHSASVRRECESKWQHAVDKSVRLLADFCKHESHAQDDYCVDAAETLRADHDHRIQECELSDLRRHMGLDNPWLVMWAVRQVESFSWPFLLVTGLFLLVWLYQLRTRLAVLNFTKSQFDNAYYVPRSTQELKHE